jgi:hypothetical protein
MLTLRLSRIEDSVFEVVQHVGWEGFATDPDFNEFDKFVLYWNE